MSEETRYCITYKGSEIGGSVYNKNNKWSNIEGTKPSDIWKFTSASSARQYISLRREINPELGVWKYAEVRHLVNGKPAALSLELAGFITEDELRSNFKGPDPEPEPSSVEVTLKFDSMSDLVRWLERMNRDT